MAAKFCESLMGQFRRNDADDPDTFVTAITAIMADYPPVVLEVVCSPTAGLATNGNFVTSVFEVREACNAQLDLMIGRWKWDRLPPERKAKIAAVTRQEQVLALISESVRPTKADLKAKYGENFGIGADDAPKEYTPRSLAEIAVSANGRIADHYSRYGLSFKPKSIVKEKHHGYHSDNEGPFGDGVLQAGADTQGQSPRGDAETGERGTPQGAGGEE